MKAESRCGIACGGCEYREQMNCGGCLAIEKPFWGEECPVKGCCEKRELEHCGLCAEFPCALAKRFAHDPKQGDGGLRLKQCAAWAGKKLEEAAK